PYSFHDRLAIVTGAGGGIGAAVAQTLAAHGAAIAALDRDGTALDDLVAKLTADDRTARAYPVDVTGPAAVEKVVERVEEDLGPVDILVNVAGVLRTGPILAMSDDDWSAVFAVNTSGVFHASRTVARRMAARRRGAIVTVGSNAGSVPRMHMAAY